MLHAFAALPPPLRRYLLAVGVAGPALAVTLALAAPVRLAGPDLPAAALLTGLAALAHRYPLRLCHKTTVNVAGAAHLAMILVLPLPAPGLLAMLATAGGALLRRVDPFDPPEALFNLGQSALYVTAGALCYAATDGLRAAGPPWPHGLGALGAIALTAATAHLVNTALVAGAVARQLGGHPARVWVRNLAVDLPAQASLAGLGVAAAVLAAAQPLALPLLGLPIGLVHRALGQTVRLRQDVHAALAALVDVVELRDPYTAGHSRRVAATARALALRLGLTHEEADLIESAGRVHDIGKVALDPRVLAKPGRLDEAEWAEMKRHPVLGADVVARFAAFWDGVPLVRHHHERWDGGGYPDGLAGEAIPFGARILAVADTFDALTSARPYRQPMSVAEGLRLLAAGAGEQWDARVVGAVCAHAGGQSHVRRRDAAEGLVAGDVVVAVRDEPLDRHEREQGGGGDRLLDEPRGAPEQPLGADAAVAAGRGFVDDLELVTGGHHAAGQDLR